jgi:polar amino acid transport system ATP-binding protein
MAMGSGMSGSSLLMSGVTLSRGGRTIVSRVSMEARPGELIVLRGASGSGKTTILRAIAGLDAFDEGTIQAGDARLEGGKAADQAMLHRLRRSVGFVFQFHCLFEHLTALQNICLAPVHVHRTPARDAERRARELLRELGVEERASALPGQLSGGEAQRVAIARALAVDPPVLLMDEPMASLDPSRRAELGAQLRRLTAAGRTLMVTSHDEAFSNQFATRIVTIENGQLI